MNMYRPVATPMATNFEYDALKAQGYDLRFPPDRLIVSKNNRIVLEVRTHKSRTARVSAAYRALVGASK